VNKIDLNAERRVTRVLPDLRIDNKPHPLCNVQFLVSTIFVFVIPACYPVKRGRKLYRESIEDI